jgi:DNA-directed RNA polymerase
MRRFVRDMGRANCKDLWAVHDSFGSHANHIEQMRTILREQFTVIHNLKTGSPNVLLNTVQRVINNLPTQKLVELSKLWETKHHEANKWKKYAKENNHPLQITKKILGIAVLETVNDLLGEMDDGDNNSNYFVN